MKVDKSNQCFFITPLLDTLSVKTFHQMTGTTNALVILSARFIELGKVDLVYPFFVLLTRPRKTVGRLTRFMELGKVDLPRKKGGEVKYTIGSCCCLYINNNFTWSPNF